MVSLDSIKKILALALPMAGTQFINVGSGFLCMTMLAHLGPHVLAASALIFSTQLSIMVTGMSILFSLSVLIGHAYGAKNYVSIGNFVQQGWTVGLLLSIPIIILFWHIGAILIFLGESKSIAHIVQAYFQAYSWAVIPGFLSTCNQQFGYSIHKKMLIISTSFMSILILLITAYALIFGQWGMPKLGVAGLGYAITAQYLFFFIFTSVFFYVEKSFKKFELFRYRVHQHKEHFFQMAKIGWPICVQMGGEMLSFFVSSIMIGWISLTALAAFQVVNQYYCLIVIPIFSLSQASGILVGHARGSQQFQDIKQFGHGSILLALMAGLFVTSLFLLFPDNLASFYIQIHNSANKSLLDLITVLFMIIAFSQLFDSCRNVFIGLLRGLFDTRFPMLISLFSIWIIGMPLSYVLAFSFHFGAPGFVFGGLIGMLTGVSIMAYRWQRLTQQYP